METVLQVWPVLSGIIVVPIVNQLKKLISPEWILPVTGVLNILFVCGLWYLFGDVWDWKHILLLALGAQVTSQATRRATK